MYTLGIMMGGNMICNALNSTGAFEVYYG